ERAARGTAARRDRPGDRPPPPPPPRRGAGGAVPPGPVPRRRPAHRAGAVRGVVAERAGVAGRARRRHRGAPRLRGRGGIALLRAQAPV
ncbi:MAG: hypothetical protein AVDCRST_MAG66-457, partial [uncultured Pseudonocardia sp.]